MQGIGLLGLLVVVALIFYLMFAAGGSGSAGTALKAKQESEQQVYKVTGHDTQGAAATDSLKYETTDKGIRVTDVTAGGAFDTKYGITAGDVILEVGPLVAKEQAGDAKGMLMLGYARDEPILVQRGTQRLKLPDQRSQAPVVSDPTATQQPTAEPQQPVQRTTPRGQLNDILKRRDDNDVPKH